MLSTPGIRDTPTEMDEPAPARPGVLRSVWRSVFGTPVSVQVVAPGIKFDTLVDQVKFLSHRATAVLALFGALRFQSATLLADDSLNMDAVYEVLDALIGASLSRVDCS